jgi:hypothetical protein
MQEPDVKKFRLSKLLLMYSFQTRTQTQTQLQHSLWPASAIASDESVDYDFENLWVGRLEL